MPSLSPRSPRGLDKQASVKSYEWKVVNGRLLRRSRSRPHERAVSSRWDARAILPRFVNEASVSPHRPGAGADLHPRGLAAIEPTQSVVDSTTTASPRQPQRSSRLGKAIDWSCGQLHLMCSASLPISPKLYDADADGDGAAFREQRSFARPSNRSEAVQLTQNLDRRLSEPNADFLATERAWQVTFCELVRQVYVHCAERGELLDRIRRWYEMELKRLNDMLAKSKERERKLQEMVRTRDGFSMAELDSNIAMSSQVRFHSDPAR